MTQFNKQRIKSLLNKLKDAILRTILILLTITLLTILIGIIIIIAVYKIG